MLQFFLFLLQQGSLYDDSRLLKLYLNEKYLLTCSGTLFEEDALAEDGFYYAEAV